MVKKKNNNVWYILGGVVIVVLVLWLVLANIGNNKVVCNHPYIQVGESCCLDENSNNVCDNDEIQEQQKEPEKKIWALTDFKLFGTTWFNLPISHSGFYQLDFDRVIPEYPPNPANIELGLKQVYDNPSYQEKTWYPCKNYEGALLVITSDVSNDYDDLENVSCIVEEYYDGVLNEKTSHKFKWTGASGDKNNYGLYFSLIFEKDKHPSEAKYIITCTGESSKIIISKTFKFNIKYSDEIVVKQSVCSESDIS